MVNCVNSVILSLYQEKLCLLHRCAGGQQQKNNYYIYYNAQRREMSSAKCRKCDDSPIFLQLAKHQTLKRLVSF